MEDKIEPTHSVSDPRAHYRELLNTYKTANEKLHDLSWRLHDIDEEIAVLVRECADLSAEAAEALQQQVTDLRFWKSTLEDMILRQMLRIDELGSTLAHLRRSLNESER